MTTFKFICIRFSILLTGFTSTFVFAQRPPYPSITFAVGHYESFHSNLLNEERTLLVHLPDDYNESSKMYPVLYILDAENIERFRQSIMAITFYGSVRRIPRMIVVGILNTDRTRDLTPWKVEQWKNSGGGNVFLDFIDSELTPYLRLKYRCAPYRILFGGSSAGTFTLHALFAMPESFDAYIASRPALNSTDDYSWDSNRLFDDAKTFFKDRPSLMKSVYIDYGGQEDEFHDPSPIDSLSTFVRKCAPKRLHWETREIGESGYRSAESLKEGLMSIFQGWYYPADSIYASGLPCIENHARRMTEQFDYPVTIADILAERDLVIFGHQFLERVLVKKAIALFKYAVEAYAYSWYVFHSFAEALMMDGQYEQAILQYEKSLELNPENTDAIKKLKRLRDE